MSQAAQGRGTLHGSAQVRRRVAGFVVTESDYAANLRIGRHDHELASLCIVLKGGYDESFGSRNARRRAAPGAVIVHPEGEHHEETHDPVDTRLLTVEIDAEFLRTLRPLARAMGDAWHRTDYVIAALAYRLRSGLARVDRGSALVVESGILEILSVLDRARSTQAGDAGWLGRVRDALEAGFQEPPTMGQLSALAGVHPVYLARAFRRRTT